MKKIKNQIEELGLDYKKEMITLVLIILVLVGVGALMYLYLESIFSLIGALFFGAFISYLYLSRYQSKIDKLNIQRRKELINLITFFEIYINNNVNVYQSLINISSFASPFIKEKLDQLLKEIDEDKSVTPFINFAKNFKSMVIEQLLISIYQLVDEGNSLTSINQFQAIFIKINEEEHANNLEIRYKRLDRANVTPLIGAAMITIIVSIGIVGAIGGIISG